MEQRTTRQKQLIMDILLHAQQPLTAQEVHARAVRQLPNLAKSTVYRNLEAMKARGEITQGMLDNGESYYEAVHDGEHKHYLVCKDCHIRVDLPDCPLAQMQQEIAAAADFTITDHVIQLYGYCRECAARRRMQPGDKKGPDHHGSGR